MAPAQLSNGVYLRSTINASPATDPQVLSAFSSDIIPLGHTQPDIATLVAAYSNFIAHEIDPSESKTRIYLRGKAVINGAAKKVETQVSLKTIPNELILWPQAWENAPQIGQATLSASKDGQVVVTNTPIVYNPTQGLGRHDTLIAEATTGAAKASATTLVQQVHNWRDLVKLVGGDATLATYNVVFADPCSANGHIIYDHTSGGDPVVAIRKYNTTSPEAPVLFSEPFNFSDPPPPPGGDHFCLIAECKPDGLDVDGQPYEWPHEETGDFATAAEYAAWIRSCPCVCQRNICYISNPNAPSQVFYTSFTIPASFSASDVWIFQVQALNCPSGSYIMHSEMDSSDADIKIGKLTITGSDQTAGAEFTGKAPGFTCQVVIRWYANGTKVQDGQKITGNLALQLLATSITGDELFRRRNTGKPSAPAVRTVTPDYPNVKIPGEDNTGEKQPPKIGGAHPRRVLGEKYRLNAAIYIDYIIGTDGMGYNLALA
ncbi:predicted protein [Postia placenta Mad-698-R]|nr:predicted protein [Postia placenta Mad-698-R]